MRSAQSPSTVCARACVCVWGGGGGGGCASVRLCDTSLVCGHQAIAGTLITLRAYLRLIGCLELPMHAIQRRHHSHGYSAISALQGRAFAIFIVPI